MRCLRVTKSRFKKMIHSKKIKKKLCYEFSRYLIDRKRIFSKNFCIKSIKKGSFGFHELRIWQVMCSFVYEVVQNRRINAILICQSLLGVSKIKFEVKVVVNNLGKIWT